jgi:hypothetical protein
MKQHIVTFFLLTILLAACAGRQSKVIFRPDPGQDILQEQTGPSETWQIIESQNGPGETDIPEWVLRYYSRELRTLETPRAYGGKYLFIGRSRGDNLNVLRQWINGFSLVQDMPRLVAQRVERRLIVTASLYPDDEYGEYFETLIKKISDGEYPGAVVEQTFWVKRKLIPRDEESNTGVELENENIISERYESLILISINKDMLQKQIQEIIEGIKTTTPPTREQTAAINGIRQSFFEGF